MSQSVGLTSDEHEKRSCFRGFESKIGQFLPSFNQIKVTSSFLTDFSTLSA